MVDKRCSNPKCKNPLKPKSEFSLDRTTPDGLRYWCKVCCKEYDDKRKQLQRDQYLEREFGFLPGDIEKISKSQNHKCLICDETKKLVPDHSHKTYLNRGLLCIFCNGNLGWYENNPIQEYLNKPEWKFMFPWLSTRNQRDYKLRYDHNICLDDFEMMFKAQNGVCGICFKICTTGRNLAVDHDHQTQRIRGLLCSSCNMKLGWFDDNSINILNYLKQNTPLTLL